MSPPSAHRRISLIETRKVPLGRRRGWLMWGSPALPGAVHDLDLDRRSRHTVEV